MGIFPSKGENNKSLKPPPSFSYFGGAATKVRSDFPHLSKLGSLNVRQLGFYPI